MDITLEPPRTDGQSWTVPFPAHDSGPGWEWSHFDLVPGQARSAIESSSALPAFAKQILTGTDETPRIVTDGTVVAGVLPSFARTGDADEYDLTYWHFAMTAESLVTGRRRSSRTLVHLWELARSGGLQTIGPASLMELAIAHFAREVRGRLTSIEADIDAVEDRLIDAGDASRLNDLGGRLGAARRQAAQLKRALSPVERALEFEQDDLPPWSCAIADGAGRRALHAALDDIAALYERTRALHDELTTRLAEETNRRLYLVSVVTTLFVPATFITGFFGMNTGGLLWGGDAAPHGTLFATLLCTAAVASTLLLLRLKRLL